REKWKVVARRKPGGNKTGVAPASHLSKRHWRSENSAGSTRDPGHRNRKRSTARHFRVGSGSRYRSLQLEDLALRRAEEVWEGRRSGWAPRTSFQKTAVSGGGTYLDS